MRFHTGQNISKQIRRKNKKAHVSFMQENTEESTSSDESSSSKDKDALRSTHVILRSANQFHHVIVVRRGAGEQPFPKNLQADEQGLAPIEDLLNQTPEGPRKEKRKKKKNKTKVSLKSAREKVTKKKHRNLNAEDLEKYDVVPALTNAPSRKTFVELWHWDAMAASKVLDRIFGTCRLEIGSASDLKSGAAYN